MKANTKLSRKQPIIDEETIRVVIETPRGKRNKFKYDEQQDAFVLSSVLPAGNAFPYDFGFVPGTKGDDGDPIDVLVLMDESAYPGCMIKARLIGVLEAEQREDGETVRNDRLVAVADEAHDYGEIKSIHDIDAHLLKELEEFFIGYNRTRGKEFKLLNVGGRKRAWNMLHASLKKPKKRK